MLPCLKPKNKRKFGFENFLYSNSIIFKQQEKLSNLEDHSPDAKVMKDITPPVAFQSVESQSQITIGNENCNPHFRIKTRSL